MTVGIMSVVTVEARAIDLMFLKSSFTARDRSCLPSFLYTTPLTQQSPDANSTRSYRQTAKHTPTGYSEQQYQIKCLNNSTSVAIAV